MRGRRPAMADGLGSWTRGAVGLMLSIVAGLSVLQPEVAFAQTGWQTGTTVVEGAKPAPVVPKPSAVVPKKAPAPGPAVVASPKRLVAAEPALRSTAAATATAVRLTGTGDRARFVLTLDRAVDAAIFTVADPFRVIVDMPDVDFRLPAESGRGQAGPITGFRYGSFQAGRSRIVIDTGVPVMVERQTVGSVRAGGAEVAFDLVRIDRAEFQAIAAAEQARGAPLRGTRTETAPVAKRSQRPVIVIDPGHGGLDPGTVSGGDFAEKTIVLAVGRQIAAALSALGKYDVHLTRSDDVFVALDERVRFARGAGADLFVSLHADAIAEKEYTALVRGATIYTLSDKASDEVARRAAEKENASDTLAGVEGVSHGEDDHVRSILSDLMRRETSDFSSEIRNLLIDRLKGKVTLSKDPRRSASFAVLRQADTPSVLIELGYLSNPEDRARLISADWQKQVSSAVAAAVDTYFARRPRVTARSIP